MISEERVFADVPNRRPDKAVVHGGNWTSIFQIYFCYMINPLLTELVGSRWLDTSLVPYLHFYEPRLRLGP